MKLWLLHLVKSSNAMVTYYDQALGFVVRAETEADARVLVAQLRSHDEYFEDGDDEVPEYAGIEGVGAWSDPQRSTCVELKLEGLREVVLRDFRAG